VRERVAGYSKRKKAGMSNELNGRTERRKERGEGGGGTVMANGGFFFSKGGGGKEGENRLTLGKRKEKSGNPIDA